MEQILLGKQLETKLADIDEEDAREKERRKIVADRTAGMWDDVREIRRQIVHSVRRELRTVKILASWSNGRIRVSDKSTGQVYEDREMTKEEKQVGFL